MVETGRATSTLQTNKIITNYSKLIKEKMYRTKQNKCTENGEKVVINSKKINRLNRN